MHKKLSALTAFVALTIAALASGATAALADETQWNRNVGESGSIVLAQYNCAGGSTDCPTAINHSPRHYGKHRHYRGGHRYHRRHWGPRYKRRHFRPHVGIYVPIVPHVAPRYRPAPRVHLSHAHIRWCHNRYRSYRTWDNTFQPYRGPRRQCRSPYG